MAEKSEKVLSWAMTVLGVILFGVGTIGYFAGKPEKISYSHKINPEGLGLIETKGPIVLFTVEALRGDLWERVQKDPTLAPHFANLARTSHYFASAQAPSSSSISSMASLLTGTYAAVHQYYWYPWYKLPNGKTVSETQAAAFPPDIHALAGLLPHYVASAWGNTWFFTRNESLAAHWDKFYLSPYRADPGKRDALFSITGPSIDDFLAYNVGKNTNVQLEWFHFSNLEMPWDISKKDLKQTQNTPSEKELQSFQYWMGLHAADKNKDPKKAELYRDLYWATVRRWDRDLGRVIQGMKKQGTYESATLVLVGVVGQPLGEYQQWGPETGLSPAALQVPLLIKLPNQREGKTHTHPVSTVAVAPTLRELAGYPPSPQFQSRSLAAHWKSGEFAAEPILSELYRPNGRVWRIEDQGRVRECEEGLDGKQRGCRNLTAAAVPDSIREKAKRDLCAGRDPFALVRSAL